MKSFPPLDSLPSLPDEQILALCDMMMDDADQEELSDLLWQQNAGVIDDAGREGLAALMNIYRNGLVVKATALEIAVHRGLQPRGPYGRESQEK